MLLTVSLVQDGRICCVNSNQTRRLGHSLNGRLLDDHTLCRNSFGIWFTWQLFFLLLHIWFIWLFDSCQLIAQLILLSPYGFHYMSSEHSFMSLIPKIFWVACLSDTYGHVIWLMSSTIGFRAFLGDSVITQQIKKVIVVTRSNMESKVVDTTMSFFGCIGY